MFWSGNAIAQSLFEPIHASVYDFLDEITLTHPILSQPQRPLSRNEIAEYLLSIEKLSPLTSLQSETLDYYLLEFGDEVKRVQNSEMDSLLYFISAPSKDQYNLFYYRDKSFQIQINPILGYEFSTLGGKTTSHRWNGFEVGGYIGNNWSFSLDFRDNAISGPHIDFEKRISRQDGVKYLQQKPDFVDYSKVNYSLTYDWKWGYLSFRKDYLVLGSGMQGQLIHSAKAPSYPHLLLSVSPVDWLNYMYVHGELESGIIDSSTIRHTSVPGRLSYSSIPKYYIAHLLSVYPFSGVHFSVGESIVYSDHLEVLYFIPFSFLRPSDHYIQNSGGDSGDNAQIFIDASWTIPSIQSKFFGTLFIDELSISDLLKGGNLSAIGYTVGTFFKNPLWDDCTINLEYTRINPFVYRNSNDAQWYTSNGFQLGHWLGSNGDVFSVEIVQRFLLRGLQFRFLWDAIRKGQVEKPEEQYQLPYPGFLYGERYSENRIECRLQYEYLLGLRAELQFTHTSVRDPGKLLSDSWRVGDHSSFSFSVYFGM